MHERQFGELTMNMPRTFGSGRRFLFLLAGVVLVSVGCATNTTNNNNGNCDAAGGSNSLNCSSVRAGGSDGTTASAASAQASGSAHAILPVATAPGSAAAANGAARPQRGSPKLYIYTGTGTMAALQVNSTEASGISPAKISVPGGTIEDGYGSKIPLPTGCGYTNDDFPGWWVPYAVSSASRYAGLSCALFLGKTESTIANVVVAVWDELPAPYTGSYVSQCLTYVTFSPAGSNPVGAYENVSLYWTGTAWKDVPNVYGAWNQHCN
jgi:hypothetical protein